MKCAQLGVDSYFNGSMIVFFQHLNSPRHNINYADSMAKAKADSAPGSALGGHHGGGSMHASGSMGDNLNSYSIPMLNMFLQTLQPPAQNCRCVKIVNKEAGGPQPGAVE